MKITHVEALDTPIEAETVETLPEVSPGTATPEIGLRDAYRAALQTYTGSAVETRHAARKVAEHEREFTEVQTRIADLETQRMKAMDANDLATIRCALLAQQGLSSDIDILLANWRRVLKNSEQDMNRALRNCHITRERLIRWKVQQHMAALVPHVEALLPLWLMTAQDHEAHTLAAFFALPFPNADQTRKHLTGWFDDMGLTFKPEELHNVVQ